MARSSGMKLITTAAAAGLLWTQAASAAAPQLSAPVDPLVALSALGTSGSSAAVCGAGQSDVNGCTLAMNEAAQPADAQSQPSQDADARPSMGLVPLLIALGGVVIVAVILASQSNHGSGNLSPVSPA